MKSRQDNDHLSFEELSPNESARRVVVKGSVSVKGLQIPNHDRGEGEQTSPTVETYRYYLADVLVGTLVITFSDSSKEFMTAWELT